MPCGGIYPGAPGMSVEEIEREAEEGGRDWDCWVCHKSGARHFMEEFDTFIHARCAIAFLDEGLRGRNEEAEIIFNHGHEVILDMGLEMPKMKTIDPTEGPEIDPDDPWDSGPDGLETIFE